MKPAIAALANHIAASFDIHLSIEPLDSDDHGTILIDRSSGQNLEKKSKIINDLLNAGSRQGCTAYESLLLLKNVNQLNSQNNFTTPPTDFKNSPNNQATVNNDISINEFDVVTVKKYINRASWELIEHADKLVDEARFWDNTGDVDKLKQSVPGSLSIIAIHYEACRGLEAWSTMCFDINSFFESKRNEDDAENFLLDEVMEPQGRKDKYAATWVLMALTRSIDTVYIELINSDNSLNKYLEDFIVKNPKFIQYTK